MTHEEKLWRKAIQIVNRDYPEVPQGSSHWWSLVFGVFKRMMGRRPIRALAREGILKKDINLSLPILALLNLLEPMLTTQGPITLQQLILDLPPPPTMADLIALAPHYSNFFPHLSQPASEDDIRNSYLKQPVFVPLSPNELVFFLRGHPVTFAMMSTEEENHEWVKNFNSLWYLSLLVGMASGVIPPRGREGWRWVLQIASNPFYRQMLQEKFDGAWESVRRNFPLLQSKTWEDCISLRHRQAFLRWKKPLTGVVISPATLQQVWCIEKELLSKPLITSHLGINDLPNWFIETLSKIRPLLSILTQPDDSKTTWVPFIGGTLNNVERDCIAIVVFSSKGINSSIPIVEVDFDTPYEDIVQIVRTLYLKQRRS